MKLKGVLLMLALAALGVLFSYNNSKFYKLLVANIEALTDSYENKKDSNGSTLTVNSISKELTKAEKDALEGELYYIIRGLPNPYHWMHTDTTSYQDESFYNTTKNKWENIKKCTGKKALCSGDIKGKCWSILYPFYGS